MPRYLRALEVQVSVEGSLTMSACLSVCEKSFWNLSSPLILKCRAQKGRQKSRWWQWSHASSLQKRPFIFVASSLCSCYSAFLSKECWYLSLRSAHTRTSNGTRPGPVWAEFIYSHSYLLFLGRLLKSCHQSTLSTLLRWISEFLHTKSCVPYWNLHYGQSKCLPDLKNNSSHLFGTFQIINKSLI